MEQREFEKFSRALSRRLEERDIKIRVLFSHIKGCETLRVDSSNTARPMVNDATGRRYSLDELSTLQKPVMIAGGLDGVKAFVALMEENY